MLAFNQFPKCYFKKIGGLVMDGLLKFKKHKGLRKKMLLSSYKNVKKVGVHRKTYHPIDNRQQLERSRRSDHSISRGQIALLSEDSLLELHRQSFGRKIYFFGLIPDSKTV